MKKKHSSFVFFFFFNSSISISCCYLSISFSYFKISYLHFQFVFLPILHIEWRAAMNYEVLIYSAQVWEKMCVLSKIDLTFALIELVGEIDLNKNKINI